MRTVLVVEDDPDIREMMQAFLEGAGYAAPGAANGQEALDVMRARRPDLVLLDISMPVMDGWEFRRHQTADASLSDIPVIGVTAHCDPGQVATTLQIPCLGKPFHFDVLLGAIAAVCR